MSNEIQEELARIKQELDKYKQLRATAIAKKEAAEEQGRMLLLKLKKLGISDPQELGEVIKTKNTDMNERLVNIENLFAKVRGLGG